MPLLNLAASLPSLMWIRHTNLIFSLWISINPFMANIPFLYPLKKQRFLTVFRGYKMGILARNGLSIGKLYGGKKSNFNSA